MPSLTHDLLSQAAATAPDREAVRSRGRSWSYGRLEAASNTLARSLLDLGVQRGDRVAILLPKRPEAIAAIYGVLKTGAMYVPLDPHAPAPYVAAVASDCAAGALVTTSSRALELLDGVVQPRPRGVVLMDQPAESEHFPVPSLVYAETGPASASAVPSVRISELDPACLLYTSGSTGSPKGVTHTHLALRAGAEWFCRQLQVRSADRIFAHAPLHFVLSLYGIFAPAFAGATSVLISLERAFRGADLAGLVGAEQVTVWVSVPFPLRSLFGSGASPESLQSLRAVMCGGGSLTGGDIRALQRLIPEIRVLQVYGSTEATAVCCHFVDDIPEDDRPVPIGRPVEDASVLVVRTDGSTAGPGEEGELYVRGPRVMKGYWGDPTRTAQVMVPNPLGDGSEGAYYRSGDVVRVRGDGKLEYGKRLDEMVKTRGHRVELGEVEAVLNSHSAVRDSVAFPLPHPDWGVAIGACVALTHGQRATGTDLKAHVAARLPSYMVPFRIEVVADLPRTSTGKVDRQRLIAEFSRAGV